MEVFSIFVFILSHIYSLITRKRSMRCTSSLRSCQPSIFHTKMGESRLALSPTAQQGHLQACFPLCPFNAEHQAEKLRIPIFKSLVFPDWESNLSLQPEADALTAWPSELFKSNLSGKYITLCLYATATLSFHPKLL